MSKTEQYLTRAIEYIQQKYSDTDLRVGDIAGYVGIDRTYLYRIFYDSFQQSVQDFVLEFRSMICREYPAMFPLETEKGTRFFHQSDAFFSPAGHAK